MKIIRNNILLLGLAFIIACGPSEDKREADSLEEDSELMEAHDEAKEDNGDRKGEEKAIANISGVGESNLTGTATFKAKDNDKMKFKLEVENATPGKHAVHLHENGNCDNNAEAAGGHWNPTDEKHGKRGDKPFHKGDILNLEVGEDGRGSVEMDVEGWCIGGNANCDILNKAVIIHAGVDDFVSQPSGAAGDRVGCGVIERSKKTQG